MTFEQKRKLWNRSVKAAVYAASILTAALLVGLIGYILYRGVPNLSWELVSTQTSYIRGTMASCRILQTRCISSSWPW